MQIYVFAQETTEQLFHHLYPILYMCVHVPINMYIKNNIGLHFAITSSGLTPHNAIDSRIRPSKTPNWPWQEVRCRKVSVNASSNM